MHIESQSIEKKLEPFRKIVHRGYGDLILKKGDEHSISISSKQDILEYISFEVRNDVLYIRMRDFIELGLKSMLKLKKPEFRIEVIFEDLEELVQKGMGSVSNNGVLEMFKLKVENRGVGDVRLNVDVKEMQTVLEGVGNIDINGSAEIHECELTGTGRINARELIAEETRVVSNGVGNAEVYASEKLKADLRGVGKITYYGKPKQVESSINGLGSIVAGL